MFEFSWGVLAVFLVEPFSMWENNNAPLFPLYKRLWLSFMSELTRKDYSFFRTRECQVLYLFDICMGPNNNTRPNISWH
jgi:hypothetical protein